MVSTMVSSSRACPSWVPLSESMAVVFMVLGMFSSVNSCACAMAPLSSHSIIPWSFTVKSVMVGFPSSSRSAIT